MVSLKQRISIHRMRRSTPPSLVPVDPWRAPGHFRAGETILAADASGYWPVVVEADDYTDRGIYLPEAGGDYRHQQGCTACAADLGEGTRGLGPQYEEHRQHFTVAALARANALWNGPVLPTVAQPAR